jgi:hypothetical protein
VALPTWWRRDAGFATLPGSAWALLGVGATGWFGWWWARPFRGDDRGELGPQQVLIGAEHLQELLLRGAGGSLLASRPSVCRIWGITVTPGLRR